MAKSVATVWVPVDDMDRAKKFYGETLHFEVGKETPEWSEVDAGQPDHRAATPARAPSAHADGGAVITFTPEGGIDAEVERLQGEGVTFTGGISDHPWGRIAPFKDSEGNDLQLYARRPAGLGAPPV